jgi:hypothetical protein
VSGIKNIKTGLRGLFAMAVLAAALVVPAQAMAQQSCSNAGSDPTASQYCSVSGVTNHGNGNHGKNGVQGVTDEGATTPVADVTPVATTAVESSSSGSLPFTGLDVGILALVAVGLTGTGLLLRRLTAHGVGRS